MIEPQGPLPPEIYWRRRAVAAGGALVVVALVVGLIVWMTSGNDADPANTASSSSASSSAPAAEPSEASPSESDIPGNGGGAGGGGTGGGGTGEGGSSVPPGQSAPASSTVPGQPAPAGDGSPAPQGGLCPDQSISVVLLMDKPTYTLGQQPVFTIVTTNSGVSACTRDVGKAAQNVVVRTLDGTRTLWSARDCSPINTVNNQLLQPGQQVRDKITWSGTTSNPGCDKPRVQVPVGSYKATGKMGERESDPVTFNVVAPAQQP